MKIWVLKENILVWFVNRLPRWLIERAAVRLIARACAGKYKSISITELKALDALNYWKEAK